ncbi:MAG TPA: S8 family serine peptidase, partial [Methylomirabilota bacterium]|nr:S8 family serine peptidase [Methylomirabilota bacterium]
MAGAQPEWIQLGKHEAHPTRILARYKDPEGVRVADELLNSLGIQQVREVKLVPGLVAFDVRRDAPRLQAIIPLDPAENLLERIQKLRATGLFEYVDPDYIHRPARVPTDARFQDGTLWGLRNNGDAGGVVGADIDAVRAWDITTGSRDVVIAVIDTGVRYTHQDIAEQMWRNPGETGIDANGNDMATNGIDDDGDGFVDNVFGINAITGSGDPMDDNGHGSHVAGTIGARANAGGPHVGVAWNVQIMALKFLGASGGGSTLDAVTCLDFAVSKGVRISNNSWGGGPFEQALFDALVAAREAGHLFIAAAANDANNNDLNPAFPASYDLDNIISVAALDRADRLADFSNFGRNSVDLGAPGVEIFSLSAESDMAYMSIPGTSMAAPHVSGVAALLLSEYPQASYHELRERLLLTTVAVPDLTGVSVTGGRVNAFAALNAIPDGIIELSVTPPSGALVLAGSDQPVFVRVTDMFSLPGATVTGQIAGDTGTIEFLDDGNPPDAVQGDGIYSVDLPVPEDATNLVLTVTATAPGKEEATAVVEYVVVQPPTNDDFVDSLKIPTGNARVRANNRFATMELLEPMHAGLPSAAHSLWWNWSSPTDSRVLLDTAGSSFDTVIGVYSGNRLDELTEVASVDDVGTRRQGHLDFDAEVGKTYRIAVAGAQQGQSGTIRLRIELEGQPDTTPPSVTITHPVPGQEITSRELIISGTAVDPQPNSSGVSEVFVKMGHEVAGRIAEGSTNWSARVLLKDELNTIEATAFDFAGNISSTHRITVRFMASDPQNDHFANAAPLDPAGGTATVDTQLATRESGEPSHAGNEGGRSVWWRFTPPEDGVLFLSTSNSTFDTLMGVYTGDHVTNLTEVASNDDAFPDVTFSKVSLGLAGGETYHIAVDGYDGAFGTLELDYTFNPTQTHTLTLSATEGGTVTPASGLFEAGSTVVIEAIPDDNYTFMAWQGDVDPADANFNPLSLVMSSDRTVVAQFALRQFTEDFESGGLSSLPWQTGGAAPWTVQTNVVALGDFSAQSGAIGHGQHSSLS